MGRVRQKGTRAELAVAASLTALGLRYRKNVRALPGSPDFANRSRRWAVFVNGCFWHRHTGCRRATTPTANHAFWLEKFAANRTRDAKAIQALRAKGFKVVIVWECQTAEAGRRLSDVLKPGRVDVRRSVDH
jgi:DNA mismatch endonuclease (patch repair protein)